jgi:UDP-glucose 4-epimerase
MNILVTGGAGFLGSHLSEALLARGHAVTILDDLSGGFERNVPAGAKFVRGSVCDGVLVSMLCQNKFDAIYHLAAYAAEGLSHFIRRFNYTNNVVGSANLINAAVEYGVKKFIFTSSMAVYGHGLAPFDEGQTPHPCDPYGIAKYAVELDLRAASEMWGLDYTIFRPHNIYGNRQNIGDRYRNVIGIFMNQLLKNEPLTIFGTGDQKRAFSYVTDILGPMAEVLSGDRKYYRGVYNIGGDHWFSINDLARILLLVSDKSAYAINYLPPRNEVKDAFSSHELLVRDFGPQPQTGLEAGLRSMWDWAQKLGPQQPLKTPAVEMPLGLPASWR